MVYGAGPARNPRSLQQEPARRAGMRPGSALCWDMARGWESKAIESQQDDARAKGPAGPAPSPEELERREKAASVGLALADLTAQLQAACRPAQRDLLRQRVAALEALLASLAPPSGANRP